jgi:hypothetical protein
MLVDAHCLMCNVITTQRVVDLNQEHVIHVKKNKCKECITILDAIMVYWAMNSQNEANQTIFKPIAINIRTWNLFPASGSLAVAARVLQLPLVHRS